MNALVLQIASYGALAFAVALFLVQALAREGGLWLGLRMSSKGDAPPEGVGTVVGGMLGLLGFVLALTLSYSSERFQERRDGALAEANAIGTAWLRAEAIDHPRGDAIARLLADYIQVRSQFVSADQNSAEIAGINRRSSALQSEMWGHAAAIARERPDAVANTLMASLNEAFDLATAERFAYNRGIPSLLFWVLVGMGMASMAGLGFQQGLRKQPLRVLTMVLLCMWTAVMTMILDLGAARFGNFRVGTQAYEWTLQGFQNPVTVPPLPAPR